MVSTGKISSLPESTSSDRRRVLSNCLGRPVGVEDTDCDCEMPQDLEDDDLDLYCKQNQSPSSRPPRTFSRLTGFIIFSKLCQISGRISRTMNSLSLRPNKECHPSPKRIRERIRVLDIELAEWLGSVPDVIKFSANKTSGPSPHLTMCVVMYILHAGCVMNLHQ